MYIKLPNHISEAIKMLTSSGYKAYIVGGCVRDAILNKTPNDWDICTSAIPDQTCRVFGNFNLVKSGMKHGTVRVIMNHLPVEITTFRIDGDYKDNRRPESVTFSPSVEEDLKRRDFTINAMAYSEDEGIIDLNGGIKDLDAGIIRCVGNPDVRFKEDALRIMRGLRFAGQLGFNIEENTKKAILTQKDLLKNISAERITDEFIKLVSSDNYFNILTEYESVFRVFLPSFSVPEKAEIKKDLVLRLSYILSASDIQKMFGTLKLPKAEKKDVKTILINQYYKTPQNKTDVKHMLNKFGISVTQNILELKSLLGEDTDKVKNSVSEILNNNECYSIKQLDISGNDIIALGFKGDKVGEILNFLLESVINEKTTNSILSLIEHIKNKRD